MGRKHWGFTLLASVLLTVWASPAMSAGYESPDVSPQKYEIEDDDTSLDKKTPDKKSKNKSKSNIDDEEDMFNISGLVVDETKSKVGNDFYYFFTNHWDPVPGNYTITLKELAGPRLGNIIFVSVNDRLIFKRNVKPRSEEVEAAALAGVRVTKRFIKKRLDMIQELEMY